MGVCLIHQRWNLQLSADTWKSENPLYSGKALPHFEKGGNFGWFSGGIRMLSRLWQKKGPLGRIDGRMKMKRFHIWKRITFIYENESISYIKVTFIFISMLIFLKVKGIVRYYSFHFQKTGWTVLEAANFYQAQRGQLLCRCLLFRFFWCLPQKYPSWKWEIREYTLERHRQACR